MAGGFSSTVPPTSYASIIDSFRAAKKTWRSRAQYEIGAPTLTSYAYCADERKPTARPASGTAPDDMLLTVLSGECKRGTSLVAGGFNQPTVSPGSEFVVPYESFRVGKRWRHAADALTPSGPATMTSIAYCG